MRTPVTVPWVVSHTHENYNREILTTLYKLAGSNPIIDLGCGEAHITKEWNGLLVDLVQRPAVGKDILVMDIREVPALLRKTGGRYNLMVMLDSLEHLSKNDGIRLLSYMEQYVSAIAIFTPTGPFGLNPEATDPDAHKSGWFPSQFHDMGWEVMEFPEFHRFPKGVVLGAFWAWYWCKGETPTARDIAKQVGITQ